MGVISWIVFGLIAGAIAQVLLPGDDPGGSGFGGWVITMIIGIAGAIIGGFIGAALGFGGVEGFDIRSFLVAVGGALLLLVVWRMIAGKSTGHRGGMVHR